MIQSFTLLLVLISLMTVFRLIPISQNQQLKISYILLVSELILVIAFRLSPRQVGEYCASLAHYHWPTGSLFVYLGLFLLAALLLQQYSRWWAISYLGLVVFSLSLGGWIIRDLCAGNIKSFIEDRVLSLIVFMGFPITAAVGSGIFLVILLI